MGLANGRLDMTGHVWIKAACALIAAGALGGCADLFAGKKEDASAGSAVDGGAGGLPPGLTARIVLERRLDAATTAAPAATFRAALSGARLRGGLLRAPDRTAYALEPLPDGGLAITVDEADDAALGARFPNGLYLLDMTLADGSPRSIGIYVRGGFPPFPESVDPADGETGIAAIPVVTFRSESASFGVRAVDALTGEAIVFTEQSEEPAASPGKPLAAGRTYVLETSCEAGAKGGASQYRSTLVTRFETAP